MFKAPDDIHVPETAEFNVIVVDSAEFITDTRSFIAAVAVMFVFSVGLEIAVVLLIDPLKLILVVKFAVIAQLELPEAFSCIAVARLLVSLATAVVEPTNTTPVLRVARLYTTQ